ncbi:MAG: hypothetical protein DRJ10_18560 [Bacteroidetes bacterium]|nr:MAG: hypothetical protein DRJ10_18560 [Bacteroidota bacterium]
MYNDKNLIYVLTILEAIEKLQIYTKDFSNAYDFWSADEQLNFNASSNLLLAIGEETNKIEEKLKGEFENIQWVAIKDLRNRLAHDYRGSDPDILWQIINTELEPLKQALIQMIKRIEYDDEMLLSAIESDYYRHLKYLI